ncbi:zinc-binding dehydrogenase [Caballeronia sp. 15715]|uniref:zinc-binding dehydrogenase n=1 Tax=unclassified Caballeronia TaxID=2646786 RepID=UPI0039E374B4
MRTILYRSYGKPTKVLELVDVPDLAGPDANEVLIRVLSRPIHPGDLLGVEGRYRAPSDMSNVAPGGNRPGFEGMGIVEAIGSAVDARAGLSVGVRVAFFPGRWAWGERVVVAASFVTVLPADVPDDIAAQLHVNPLTAAMLVRAAEAAGLDGEGVAVVTAAASGVAKLVTALAHQRGLAVIGLVRTQAAVADQNTGQRDGPVVSTADAGWQDRVRDAAKGKPIRAVLDCVGGDLASDLLVMLGSGGTFISYGDLSGEPLRATALSFSVRNLHIHGMSVGGWTSLPEDLRAQDIRAAILLAQREPALFHVAASYDLADVTRAVEHAQRAGKGGSVLLTSH